MKKIWAIELGKLSNDEMKRGVSELSNQEWPPTLPMFIKLCRPPIDPMHAYYEAAEGVVARDRGERGRWSHRAIFWAATGLSFDLKNQTYSQIKARWEKALADQFEKTEWPPIPDAMLLVEGPSKSPQAKKKAEQMMSELGASGVLKPKADHRLWAKNILDRLKRGDKTLSLIQVKFAKEAMAELQA